MAFRGRGGGGRGRGGPGGFRGGFSGGHVNPHDLVSYELFPMKDVELPKLPDISNEERMLIGKKLMLERFWSGSSYHLEEAGPKSKRDVEIERYSDRFKKSAEAKREDLQSYLKLTPSNFPTELIQGLKRVQPDSKKLRWDQNAGENKLEHLAKLEEKFKAKDGKEPKEKKGDSDDEEEEQVEEESSDDDYNQNIDFDDDDDDLNMEEEIGPDDEDCF